MSEEQNGITVTATYLPGDEPGQVKVSLAVNEEEVRRIVREEIAAWRKEQLTEYVELPPDSGTVERQKYLEGLRSSAPTNWSSPPLEEDK